MQNDIQEIQTTLQAKQEELEGILAELRHLSDVRKAMDAPTPEELARQQVAKQREMATFVDATLEQVRHAMMGQDWDVGAQSHASHYAQWAQQQQAAGRPVMPAGQWYATEVLMKQVGTALMTGNASSNSAAAEKQQQPPSPEQPRAATRAPLTPQRSTRRSESLPAERRRRRSRSCLRRLEEASMYRIRDPRAAAWENEGDTDL